jgi:hypothetical protein
MSACALYERPAASFLEELNRPKLAVPKGRL